MTRAEKIGMYCLPDEGTVRVEKPNPSQEPVLTLTYGDNVFDLELELDSRTQYAKVSALAWDAAHQEVARSDIDDVAAPRAGNIDGTELAQVGAVEEFELRHSGKLDQQEIDAWVEAQMIKSRFSRIRGTIRFQGNHAVKPGALIEVAGMGDRFNGPAFVAGVRHMLVEGEWETTIQLGLRPEWHHERFAVNSAPAAGFQPAINGLHTGVVTQLQDDPAGEDRILVRVPSIDAAADGVWSRIATLDAGENRGSVFRPEIGDEVLMGFINDDPNHPVVLGMLHSSNKPAPIPASDDNHAKGLVTRSGLKIQFNDDGPKITIETPSGKKILVDDDAGHIQLSDETGNELLLNSDGISLTSAKDIALKAAGDINIEGVNTNIKANASALLEGASSAALNSSGDTKIQGSLVRIN